MKTFEDYLGEEIVVKKTNYSWGRLVTVKKGAHFAAVMHPDHQKAVHSLEDGQTHTFKDEQGKHWRATRKEDKIHLVNKHEPSQRLEFNRSEIS